MRSTLIFLFFLVVQLSLNAQQICTGNLGENIFSIGDFGSGEANIIQTDPKIAPGYIYTLAPPPGDGFYIITNDMSAPQWSALFGTWLAIGDNSDDPNGYMMVVNASFQPGIFYEEIVDGLCENTLYEFSADVINLIRIGVTGHSEPNLSFLLDDVEQFSTGLIPQNEQWLKQGFTFTTGPNQTSVKLTLRNNAPGGIGNDLALDNISFRPCGPSAFANAEEDFLLCANDIEPIEIRADTEIGAALQWQFYSEETNMWNDIVGANDVITFHSQFEPGSYLYRYLSAGSSSNLLNTKCRVISDVATITVLPIEFTVYDTICENVAYDFGTQKLTEGGFFEETFIASSGCDSFVDLFLTVVPDPGLSVLYNTVDPNCFGEENGFIEVLNVSGGTAPYRLFFNDTIIGNTVSQLGAGTNLLAARDRYSCEVVQEVSLFDPEEFLVSLGNDTTVAFGSIYDFNVESNQEIFLGSWEGGRTNCPTCIPNSVQPFETTVYIFEAQNEAACVSRDSIRLSAGAFEDIFYQPNIFSPNEDGYNDVFHLLSNTQAISRVKSFSVYDRYGNQVYKTENRDFRSFEYGWDGTIDNQPASEGVYIYYFEFILINEAEVIVSGDVTLVR